jgi:16S rRNA (cytosine1402-N4)-methyltransferase
VGYGGHARKILEAIQPGGQLFGFDRDQRELRRTTERFLASPIPNGSFIPIHANFTLVPVELASRGIEGVDMVLADLGLSSMQIDDPLRGFSFKQKGPLDMRMDQDREPSARDYLASVSEQELGEILISNADEPMALEIAHAIHARRGRLETTRDLAEAVCSVFPDLSFKDSEMTKKLRRTFQAIRIEVNGEFASLERFLADLPSYVKPGARMAILSFHSGEDRRVERALLAGLEGGIYSSISTEVLRPSPEERYSNSRSSSAKLRWAIRS